MTTRSDLPAVFAAGPFPVHAALRSGLGATRLRGTDLERPFWGVRTPAGASGELLGLASAYLSRASSDHVISHSTAALLWKMPLPARLQSDPGLHVSVPLGKRAPRGRGVIGHQMTLADGDFAVVSKIRVTTQARTWCDLASMLTEDELVSVGDHLISRRRKHPFRLTAGELAAAVGAFPGRRGRVILESGLPLLTTRADSPPESMIRVRIIRAGLPTPEVNPRLYDARGRFLAMPDLAFPKYWMALDYEGDGHRTNDAQWQKDIARAARVQDAGWHYTRISKADLKNSTPLIARLSRLLRERGWDGQVPHQ